jgi:hypothetical protein
LAILKSLSPFRSRTSVAMVSRSAQSLTSSWSRPQNSSSIPWGLVILQIRSIKPKLQHRLQHTVLRQQSGVNKIICATVNYVLFKGSSYDVLHSNKIIMKSFYKKNCEKYNVDNMHKPPNK